MSKIIVMDSPTEAMQVYDFAFDSIDTTGVAQLTDDQISELMSPDESEPYFQVLFTHQGDPLACVEVDETIAQPFIDMDIYLNGTYSVREIFDIIHNRAHAQLVGQYHE